MSTMLAPLKTDGSAPLRTVLSIIVDTREQTPLEFPDVYRDEFGAEWSVLTKRAALPNGSGQDYSLQGLEGRVAVSRKSKGDFFGSACPMPAAVLKALKEKGDATRYGWEKFKPQLERLAAFDYPSLVIEASAADILKGYEHSRYPGPSALGRALAIHVRYRIALDMAPRSQCAALVLRRLVWCARYIYSHG